MNLESARHDLSQALVDKTTPNGASRFQAARRVLVIQGIEAIGIEGSANLALSDVIKIAVTAPTTPPRRTFAVLMVHALAIDGLVTSSSSRLQLIHDLRLFLEAALPDVLRRSNYPFSGDSYEKLRALERLSTVIDELLQPLEPTFPSWLQGLHAG